MTIWKIVAIFLSLAHAKNDHVALPERAAGKSPISQWERIQKGSWLEADCAESALGTNVGDMGMFLYAAVPEEDEGETFDFCLGGEAECQKEDAKWISGKYTQRPGGKRCSYVHFETPSGTERLVTIRVTKKPKEAGDSPKACYRTVATARVADRGFLSNINDSSATNAGLSAPPLPSMFEVEMMELNEFRQQRGLDPLPYDEASIASHKKESDQAVAELNAARKRLGAGPLQYDYLLSMQARTNNELKTNPNSSLGYAHKWVPAGVEQNWACCSQSAGAVDTWFWNDGKWGNAHRNIASKISHTKIGWDSRWIINAQGQKQFDHTANFR